MLFARMTLQLVGFDGGAAAADMIAGINTIEMSKMDRKEKCLLRSVRSNRLCIRY